MKIHKFILEVLVQIWPELFLRYFKEYKEVYKKNAW